MPLIMYTLVTRMTDRRKPHPRGLRLYKQTRYSVSCTCRLLSHHCLLLRSVLLCNFSQPRTFKDMRKVPYLRPFTYLNSFINIAAFVYRSKNFWGNVRREIAFLPIPVPLIPSVPHSHLSLAFFSGARNQ